MYGRHQEARHACQGHLPRDRQERPHPDRILYLAVRKKILRDVFERPLGKLLLENHLVRVMGFDPKEEVIIQWIE